MDHGSTQDPARLYPHPTCNPEIESLIHLEEEENRKKKIYRSIDRNQGLEYNLLWHDNRLEQVLKQ